MKKPVFGLIMVLLTGMLWSQTIVSHTFSVHDDPKYPENFQHYEYVNPDAPQGGTLRLAAMGTFDSFHRYALRGDTPSGIDGLYDTLMHSPDDEIDSLYPLIAEKIEYPDDYSFVIFHINPNARFQDGSPITAQDVVFSFNTFYEDGVPQFRTYYEPVSQVQAVEELKVRFDLSEPSRELIHSLGSLTIIPSSFWAENDFSEPLSDPPLGSGPYVVEDYSMGEWIVYRRLEDYWARNLPSRVGLLNFDRIRYDFYKDENVMLEAFKAGEYDYRVENVAKNWATQYNGPLFDSGYIKTQEFPDQSPVGMQAFSFNITRDIFSDPRVREALNYALDFQWLNQNLFYNQYTRVRSFFQNTEYEATGLPSQEELEILEPIRDQIPPQVFSQEYNPPVTDGSGSIREGTRAALGLLQEAGWQLDQGVLKNSETGEPFSFELLIWSDSTERIALPLQENLKNMGITMDISLVDTTQAINRIRSRDYDMISYGYGSFFFPNDNLLFYFHSEYENSTYNQSGIQDPAVDYLIDGILENQGNNQRLLHWGRALDRVLQWNYLVIPQWGVDRFRVGFVDKFGRPDIQPKYSVGLSSWWFDQEQSQQYFYSQWRAQFDAALEAANPPVQESEETVTE